MNPLSDIVYRVMELSSDGIFIEGPDGCILDCNAAGLKMFGYKREEILRLRMCELVPPAAPYLKSKYIQDGLLENEQSDRLSLRKDGSLFPTVVQSRRLELEGEPYQVAFVRDISRETAVRERLTYMAKHDGLTELYNRPFILKHLRNLQSPCVLGMIDLDRFKYVNDTYGHPAGDKILRALGELLRKEPSLLAGRFGGEEFLLLFPRPDVAAARDTLEGILTKAGSLFACYGGVSFSGGLLYFDPRTRSVDAAISAADVLMYKAKRAGRHRIITE